MNALSLLLVVLSPAPVEPAPTIDEDVCEIQTRSFMLPVSITPSRAREVAAVACFVSTDGGKTWKAGGVYNRAAGGVDFLAPRDGLYWFALQVTLKDGKKEPASLAKLAPAQKVFVNAAKKAFVVRKKAAPPADVERLREEVKRLRKRVEELEKAPPLPPASIPKG